MRKYLYLIKKAKIKSWLKFWLMTNKQFTIVLSEILEGFSFNLQNTVKRYFKIFNIFGNSIQDGTPSPENPVPIHSVADDGTVTIKLRGKNLFKNIPFTSTQRGLTITNDGNSIKVTGTAVSEYYSSIIFYADGSYENYEWWATDGKINPTKGYFNSNQAKNVLSVISNNATTEPWFRLLIGRETQVEAINVNFGETSTTIFNENTEKINFIALGFLPDKTYNTEFKIQIEQGSTATSYEPYQANDFTFQTEPLRSLPNGVRDSLEADGIHRKIGIQTGTLSQTTTITLSDAKQNGAYMCNIKSAGTLTGKTIKLEAGDYKIIYELAEEIIEPYTEEQQAEYDKIKELYTFDGTTNISSTDVVPPYLQIQYYMKGE